MTVTADSERARLLCLLGTARTLAGAYSDARPLLREARAAAEAAGDIDTLGVAYFQELEVAYFSGDGPGFDAVVDEALDRLGREPPTGAFVMVLNNAAFGRYLRLELAPSRALLDRAAGIAERIGDRLAVAGTISMRGRLRTELGDRSGLDDLETALGLLVEFGSTYVTMAKFHLAAGRLLWNGPRDARSVAEEAIEHGRRTGNTTYEMFARVENVWRLADSGEWDELLGAVDHILAWADSEDSSQHRGLVAPYRAWVLALPGNLDEARTMMIGVVENARRSPGAQALVPALIVAALIQLLSGNSDEARTLALNIAPQTINSLAQRAELCRLLIASDAVDQARTVADLSTAGPTRAINSAASGHAALAEADRDDETAAVLYEGAASRWRSYGHPYELAHALAGRARCLTALNRETDPDPGDESSAIFHQLGVTQHALRKLRPPR